MGISALKVDTVGHGGQAQDACAGGQEMTRVVIGVEANEIRVENAQKDFLAHGQNSVMYGVFACGTDEQID